MKKFNVKIVRMEIYEQEIEVEAETEEQAIEEAKRLDIEEGEIEWDEIRDVEYKYGVSPA